MILTRRHVLKGAVAGAASLALPRFAIAQVSLGDSSLTTISDGTLEMPLALPVGVPADDLASLADRFGLEDGLVRARPLNVTLWQSGDRVVLIDAGSGSGFVPTAGELYANLDAAGVSPEDVTDVVFTHAHPDHLWGILDDFDEIAFPEARLYIGRTERDYWADPATVDALGEARKMFAVGASRRLEAISGGLEVFEDGDEVVPGLTAVMTPGHTPGHMSFRATAGSESVFIIGDAAVDAHLNFARPGWPSDSDQDPELAAETRSAMLANLAESGDLAVGYHLPGSGIGRVTAVGEGYEFVEETS